MQDLFSWAAQSRRESNHTVDRDRNEVAVLNALKQFPSGATAQELAHALRWDKTSVRPRLTELEYAGLVIQTGRRITEFSKKSCTVYRLMEKC